MNVVWSVVKRVQTWQRTAVFLAVVMAAIYVLVGGQGNMLRGYKAGREQGESLASVRLLLQLSDPTNGQVVDLSSLQKSIQSSLQSLKAKSSTNPNLSYLTVIDQNLTEYQAAYRTGDLAKAKTLLTGSLHGSVEPFAKTLEASATKVNGDLRDKQDLYNLINWMFYVTSLLGVVSAMTQISKAFNSNGGYKMRSLQSIMAYVPGIAIYRYADQKLALSKDEDENLKVAAMNYLAIMTPTLPDRDEEWKPSFTWETDISRQLDMAGYFAYCLNVDNAPFETMPKGVLNIKCENNAVVHALVQWMHELYNDQKLERFSCKSVWSNDRWTVTLATEGSEIHESLVRAHRDIIQRADGLSEKYGERLDYVRAALRFVTDELDVTHDNGNLNLVMTFKPSGS